MKTPTMPTTTARIAHNRAVLRRVLLPTLFASCFVAGGLAGYSLSRPIHTLLRPFATHRPVLESWSGRKLPNIPQWTSDGSPWSGPKSGLTAVLVFWATGCGSCLSELPALNAIGDVLGPSVAMYGLPIQSDVDVAACVASRKGVRWMQLRGEPEAPINPLAFALGVRKVPSLWIVDGKGVIRAERLERAEELLVALQKLLERQ